MAEGVIKMVHTPDKSKPTGLLTKILALQQN